LVQCNLKDKISAYPYTWIQLISLSLFSCKVRDHIASHSQFISLCHMMLLMALLWSNVFYLSRYISSLQKRKEWQWSITHREILSTKLWFHLFLSSDLSYIILSTKLWFVLSTILHWITVPNQKSFKAWHVSRGESTP
jgi:hypothetical protein